MQERKKPSSFVDLEDDEGLFNDKYLYDASMMPSKDVENKELREILDKAISKLSPEYRIVFTLRDVEQLSTEETAEITNLSVPAVKSRLHRARAFLRNELMEAFSQ